MGKSSPPIAVADQAGAAFGVGDMSVSDMKHQFSKFKQMSEDTSPRSVVFSERVCGSYFFLIK